MKKFLLILFLSFNCLSLEIDEKLTLRILEISDTKKTILVNRGLEDGLVVGDHAKFFLSKGVLARGVVIKASPSRSIWSLYRLIYPDDVAKDNVVNLKISTEVKLTEDSSKVVTALVDNEREFGEPVDIKEGTQSANDHQNVSASDYDELSSLKGEGPIAKNTKGNKSRQKIERSSSKVFSDHGLAINFAYSMNKLENNYQTENDTSIDSTGANALNFSIEKYFPTSSSFVKDLSLKLLYSAFTLPSAFGTDNTVDQTDMGLGISYHFYNSPNMVKSFIGYAEIELGLSKFKINSSSEAFVRDGSGNFYSLGVGGKYLINTSFQVFAKADIYKAATSFEETNLISKKEISETYIVSGTRLFVGLSYKFF